MKVAELEGAKLDYWVAKAEGWSVGELNGDLKGRVLYALAHPDRAPMAILADDQPYTGIGRWNPSANWAQGGPIIERERINIWNDGSGIRAAVYKPMVRVFFYEGPTPLVAAMRAYLASKFGEEVDQP